MSVLFFVDLYRSRLGYLRTGRTVSLVSIFVRVSDNFRSNNYTCSRINRLGDALNEEEALRHPNLIGGGGQVYLGNDRRVSSSGGMAFTRGSPRAADVA